VAPAVNVNTSTYPVTVMVTDKDERIKSGMAANVRFEFANENSSKQILVVPASSVGEDGKGQFVFIIEGDTTKATVKKQAITIGNLTPQGFEVTSGLKVGQKIAVAGLQTLLDGQDVKLN
jgi:hypothetical protein